jgi:hypothetical protein
MPWFEVEVEEKVRGIYMILAPDQSKAEQRMKDGDVTRPKVYEAIDMEIVRVEQQKK